MGKIKDYIIHKLGGFTASDIAGKMIDLYNEDLELGELYGRKDIAESLHSYACGLYGNSAETWCELMYNKLETCKIATENEYRGYTQS